MRLSERERWILTDLDHDLTATDPHLAELFAVQGPDRSLTGRAGTGGDTRTGPIHTTTKGSPVARTQQVLVTWTDDVDGGEAAETVAFALDGIDYEIDLSANNAQALRGAMAKWTDPARTVRRPTRRRRGPAPQAGSATAATVAGPAGTDPARDAGPGQTGRRPPGLTPPADPQAGAGDPP